MKELRQAADGNPVYPPILFVYQGDVADGETFFQRLWPEARAVSDQQKTLYSAFGLERAGIKEMLNPELVACGLRAAKNGSYGGKPVGDTRMMPGAFLVKRDDDGGDARIVWQHQYRHIADHPDFEQLGRHASMQQEARTTA